MPWYMAPKKDVTSCEKLWVVANKRRTTDIRMRELNTSNVVLCIYEFIVYTGEPGELKHLITQRKRKKAIDSESSGERNRKSPNYI